MAEYELNLRRNRHDSSAQFFPSTCISARLRLNLLATRLKSAIEQTLIVTDEFREPAT
jgi:hypothetical protein